MQPQVEPVYVPAQKLVVFGGAPSGKNLPFADCKADARPLFFVRFLRLFFFLQKLPYADGIFFGFDFFIRSLYVFKLLF